MTIGEKNFIDSLVSFPPHGKSCMKSVLSQHTSSFKKEFYNLQNIDASMKTFVNHSERKSQKQRICSKSIYSFRAMHHSFGKSDQ